MILRMALISQPRSLTEWGRHRSIAAAARSSRGFGSWIVSSPAGVHALDRSVTRDRVETDVWCRVVAG